MKKFIRYEEPKEKSFWSCYIVYYDMGTGKEMPVYMRKDRFDIIMKEEDLKKKYSDKISKDLKEYYDLIYKYACNEESIANDESEI